ncbi:MAG: hypothetical protein ABJP48_09500 [Erythrobacter sp.]
MSKSCLEGIDRIVRNWFHTNVGEDVAGSIRHANRMVGCVNDDPQAYKWVVLALHSALQGACVCHLTTSAGSLGAVTEGSKRNTIDYHEKSRTDKTAQAPKAYLMPLPDLLKAVRKPNSAGNPGNNEGICISEEDMEWLNWLHASRNEFVHFKSKSWSCYVSDIPELAKLISRIIQDILDVRWAFRHQDPEQIQELEESLKQLAQINL